MAGAYRTFTSEMKPSRPDRVQLERRGQVEGPTRASAASALRPDLGCLLETHVAASPHVSSVSRDPVCEALLRAACFQDERLAVARVKLASGSATLVAVPSSMWTDDPRRARVLALKRAAVRAGRRMVVVPEGALRREPRLGNAVLMAQAARSVIGAEDRIAVMAALAEEPGLALGDLIHVVRHAPDRVAAVLSLARSGVIDVDRRGPIGPMSPAWLLPSRV